MGMVRNCHDFDRVWNDRLDERTGGDDRPGRARALAEHAAACESCRCRGLVYAEFEAASPPWPAAPGPAPAAARRWEAALLAAHRSAPAPAPASAPASARPGRGRPPGRVARLGVAAGVAAAVLVASQAVLPVLFPIEAAPLPRVDRPSGLFEEAFTEATTMTWDLAREVSGPAARIGSEALTWSEPAAAFAPRLGPAEFGADDLPADPAPRGAQGPAGVELISDSARHAFRFLIRTSSDESDESDTVDGQ